ncbi:MAG: hypothetical protein NTZ67_04975 [Gammaproteobacteria bacterium]|nr:hypothetical protein [Gammaproteobacteria bacterium]
MQYKADLKLLADVIGSHNSETIKRELQKSALFLRHNPSAEARSKYEAMKLAADFIALHSELPDGWRESFDCFKNIAGYFHDNTTFANHEEKAMCAWYLLLEETLPFNFPFEEIIFLGDAFFSEPYRFSAFICFLLDQNISPSSIEQSKILHHYFSYHAFEQAEIIRTYQLIAGFSEKNDVFIRHLNNVPCMLRGFINSNVNNMRESYNVTGSFFRHKKSFEIMDDDSEFDNEPSDEIAIFEEHALMLLTLFEFEFIKVLLAYPEEYDNVFKKILFSPMRNIMLDGIPSQVLSGVINYTQTYSILKIIGSAYRNENVTIRSGDSRVEIYTDVINRNSFYIHAEYALSLPEITIKNAIKKLCLDHENVSAHHLPFLVSLSKKTFARHFNEEHDAIIQLIVDHMLEVGNGFDDKAIPCILTIKDILIPHFEKILTQYSFQINLSISNFILHKDYLPVQNVRLSQLSVVQLIKLLFPELFLKIDYPFGYYELKFRIIEAYFAFCVNNEIGFKIEDIVNKISDDEDIKIRILQESILMTSNVALMKKIIQFHVLCCQSDENKASEFFHKPFGNDVILFDYIVSQDDAEFREWAFSVILTSDEQFSSALNRLHANGRAAISHLLGSFHFNHYTGFKFIKFIADLACLNENKWFFIEYWLKETSKNFLSADIIHFIFIKAVQQSQEKIIELFFHSEINVLNADNFTNKTLEEAAEISVKKSNWDLLRVLCGFSDKVKINEAIVQKYNVLLFIGMLSKKTESTVKQVYQRDIIREIYFQDGNENTLLHLAAISGNFEAIEKAILFFQKHLSDDAVNMFLHAKNKSLLIPCCANDSPDAKKINDFLEKTREEYKNKKGLSVTDGGLWRFKRDRRPCTPELSACSDSDDENPERKTSRSEGFQEECQRLLDL